MQKAVLLSHDVRVTNEFTQICAVTGMQFEIQTFVADYDEQTLYFVDETCSTENLDAQNVHVICVGQPSSKTWLLAGQLQAESILLLPHDRSKLIELLTPSTIFTGKVIGVTHAVGGSGATTLASAIAHQLKNSGHTCVLIDVSNRYQGLDIALGFNSESVVYSSQVMNVKNFGIEGLNESDGLRFIASNAKYSIGEWLVLINYLQTQFEYVVLDIDHELVEREVMTICDEVVVSITNTIHGTSVTRILLNTLQEWNVPVGLVIRVLGGTAVQPLAIAEKLQTPLWATIPTDNRIIEQIECGFGISMVKLSSFNRAIAQLASRLVGVGNNVRTA